jgi:hypothetical protein
MRRWGSATPAVIVAAIAIWLGVHALLKRARAAAYEQELRSYTEALSPGTTRKRVEDELHTRGALYERVYGFDRTNAYADLVKIGSEPAPWYCNHNDIYIKFQFDAAEPIPDGTSDSDSDILRSTEVTPWLQECL